MYSVKFSTVPQVQPLNESGERLLIHNIANFLAVVSTCPQSLFCSFVILQNEMLYPICESKWAKPRLIDFLSDNLTPRAFRKFDYSWSNILLITQYLNMINSI